MSELTTPLALDAIAWERAPRYAGRTVNMRICCADGYRLSVQASHMHYANDATGGAPYWKGDDSTVYPFTSFEIGAVDRNPEPADVWDEFDSGGVWAWVPRAVVADLLDLHGGAVAWETPTTESEADRG